MLILIIVLTFSCLALAVFSLYLMVGPRTGVVNARLETMDPSLALVENSPVTTMAGRVAEPLNRMVPISAVEAAKLQKQLLQAGLRFPGTGTPFPAATIHLSIPHPRPGPPGCIFCGMPATNVF